MLTDPRIRDIAVVGMPDARLGELVCACVVPTPKGKNLELHDLVEIASRQGLAKNKWPQRLEIMDSLPMTSSGKLRRPVLREYVGNKIEMEA